MFIPRLAGINRPMLKTCPECSTQVHSLYRVDWCSEMMCFDCRKEHLKLLIDSDWTMADKLVIRTEKYPFTFFGRSCKIKSELVIALRDVMRGLRARRLLCEYYDREAVA